MRCTSFVVLLALGACARTPVSQVKKATRPLPGRWYTVQPGDSLDTIATRFGVPLEDIEEINGADRRDQLPRGKALFIPHGKASVATSRPTATSIATSRRARLGWPVAGGRLTSPFGKRGKQVHEGVDIAAKAGAPILAAAAGKVIYSGSGLRGYGNLVILQHADKLVTVYAHNKRNLVREGQNVRRGQLIAEVGQTGRTSGPHLHFEVRIGDKPVDPMPYLK